jgi:hypothetical protein
MLFNVASFDYVGLSVSTDEIHNEIVSFLELGDNWCYGEGRPATISAVSGALTVLATLRMEGFNRIECFPDPGGEVLLSAFSDDKSIEILSIESDIFNVVVEVPGLADEVIENCDLKTVFEKIRELSCDTPQNSSDYYTQVTTASRRAGFKAPPSRSTTVEFPSSMQSALAQLEQAYALTLGSSMPIQQATLQSSGGYIPESYQSGLSYNNLLPTVGTFATMTSSGLAIQYAGTGSEPNPLVISKSASLAA